MNLQQCVDAWNAQADEFNQWSELDADERCEWCLKMAQGGMSDATIQIATYSLNEAKYPQDERCSSFCDLRGPLSCKRRWDDSEHLRPSEACPGPGIYRLTNVEDFDKLIKGLKAVRDLIAESHGVDGLHLNGDVASWAELRTGGYFEEWLMAFDEALDVVANMEEE